MHSEKPRRLKYTVSCRWLRSPHWTSAKRYSYHSEHTEKRRVSPVSITKYGLEVYSLPRNVREQKKPKSTAMRLMTSLGTDHPLLLFHVISLLSKGTVGCPNCRTTAKNATVSGAWRVTTHSSKTTQHQHTYSTYTHRNKCFCLYDSHACIMFHSGWYKRE